MSSKKNASTLKYLRRETEQMLRERGAGKKCHRHKGRLAKLGVLWADGRAVAFLCDRKCFLDWEASQAQWAEVVQVVPINQVGKQA